MNTLDGKLDFYLKHNMNVLFIGAHGFGKTAMVEQCFNRANIKWRYFSAATIDPWVDFVGIPKEFTDENGVTYLDLVRPKDFANDEVEALFFDEFNRAPSKVRNAVMELIQFKSINGKKFNNLRVIWAAINPSDEEETYDVEELDPAQVDRFQVHVEVPSRLSMPFFAGRYGIESGKIIVDWWNAQSKEVKKKISARRLMYAIDYFLVEGDMRDILPREANCNRLIRELSSGSIIDELKRLIVLNDQAEITKFLRNDNHYAIAEDFCQQDPKLLETIIDCINDERLVTLITKDEEVLKVILNRDDVTRFYHVFKSISVNNVLSVESKKLVAKALQMRFVNIIQPTVEFYNAVQPSIVDAGAFSRTLDSIVKDSKEGFDQAKKNRAYDYLSENLTEDIMTQCPLETSMAVLCICFRIMSGSQELSLVTNYGRVIPMLNNGLKAFVNPDGTEVFNNTPNVVIQFRGSNKRYVVKRLPRVQGCLDTHDKSLLFKPRLI
jgi:hypothetical protein